MANAQHVGNDFFGTLGRVKVHFTIALAPAREFHIPSMADGRDLDFRRPGSRLDGISSSNISKKPRFIIRFSF